MLFRTAFVIASWHHIHPHISLDGEWTCKSCSSVNHEDVALCKQCHESRLSSSPSLVGLHIVPQKFVILLCHLPDQSLLFPSLLQVYSAGPIWCIQPSGVVVSDCRIVVRWVLCILIQVLAMQLG